VLDSTGPAGVSWQGARPNKAKVFESYKFGDTLGTGGFAVVRLATCRSTGKNCAMKVMTLPNPKESGGHNERENIFYEIGLLARLQSEYIIRLDEFFVENNKVYLATELLAGRALVFFSRATRQDVHSLPPTHYSALETFNLNPTP